MSSHSLKIAAWLFLPLSLLWLLAAAFFWYQSAARQWEWAKAPAVVVEVAPDENEKASDGSSIKYAFFSFRSESGKEYRVRSQMGNSGTPLWTVGEELEVIYPHDHPEAAEENLFLVQYILPLGLTLAAFLFSLLTALLFIFGRRAAGKVVG